MDFINSLFLNLKKFCTFAFYPFLYNIIVLHRNLKRSLIEMKWKIYIMAFILETIEFHSQAFFSPSSGPLYLINLVLLQVSVLKIMCLPVLLVSSPVERENKLFCHSSVHAQLLHYVLENIVTKN